MSTNISHFIGNFNPRSHEGSDQYLERVRSIDSEISIHAPTRGATKVLPRQAAEDPFQSTLPRGERHDKRERLNTDEVFQSTLPRGERHYTPNSRTKSSEFNPRSHEGSDEMKKTG